MAVIALDKQTTVVRGLVPRNIGHLLGEAELNGVGAVERDGRANWATDISEGNTLRSAVDGEFEGFLIQIEFDADDIALLTGAAVVGHAATVVFLSVRASERPPWNVAGVTDHLT